MAKHAMLLFFVEWYSSRSPK